MNNVEIIGLGALNIDHIYRVDHIPDHEETVVNEAKSFPGGSAANTIYALAKLGMKTGYAGVIGDDEEGKRLLRDFQKVGVDTSQIKIKTGAKTGSIIYIIERQGKRSICVLPGANSLLTLEDLDLTYLNQAKWLHLSSFAEKKQFKVLAELVDRLGSSTKLSFAPGVLHTAKDIISPILKRTQILFLNQHEMWHLTAQDVSDGAESCLKQGCHIIVVTLGGGAELKLGSQTINAVAYIRDKEKEYFIEPTGREVIEEDKIGTGDAFAAGFLYGLLKGKGIRQCGSLGDIVARFSLTRQGARAGFPTHPELSKRYRELYREEL